MELRDVAPKFTAYLASNGIVPSLVETADEAEYSNEFRYAHEVTEGGKYFRVMRTDEKMGMLMTVRKDGKLVRVEFKGKLPSYKNPQTSDGSLTLLSVTENRGDAHPIPFP